MGRNIKKGFVLYKIIINNVRGLGGGGGVGEGGGGFGSG